MPQTKPPNGNGYYRKPICWARCLALAVTLIATTAQPASSQTVSSTFDGVNNPIRLEFWNSSGGNFNWAGQNFTPTHDWTTEEMAAIERSVQYWWDVLGSDNTPGRSFTIRVLRNDALVREAYSKNTDTTFLGNRSIFVQHVWADQGANPAPLDSGGKPVDTVLYLGAFPWTTAANGQLPPPGTSLESVVIHEMAHSLGYCTLPGLLGGLPAFGVDINGNQIGLLPFEALLERTDGTPVTAGTIITNLNDYWFTGANAVALYGDRVHMTDITHPTIDPLLMSHQWFRNYTFFTELELAILQDLGYQIDRSQFFGKSYYQHGTAEINNDGFDSDKTYGVGLHMKANNLTIVQAANLNANGVAGAGIRIDGYANALGIAPATTVNANNDYGVGLLVSNGANNVIVHRGTINANSSAAQGAGVGMLFSFGNNVLGLESVYTNTLDPMYYAVRRNSGMVGSYLVDRVDISGTISAGGNAIEIDQTAAVREINILNGASISGDIVSNAFTNQNLNRPTITFGREDNGVGLATNNADREFRTTYSGNIGGITLMDARFVGGIDHDTGALLTGDVTFNSVVVGAEGRLTANGFFTSATDIDIEGAMRSAGGLLVAGNGITVYNGGRFSGTPFIFTPLVDNRPGGTMAPGNSIGTMTIVGTYQTNGTVEYEISHQNLPQDADLINVFGQVFINNNTSYANRGTFTFEGETSTNAEDYAIGRRYTIVATDAPGNLNVVQRPKATDNIDGRRIILRSDTDIDGLYTPNAQYYFAYIGRDASYATLGTTPNQQAIGAYLDNLLSLDDGSDLGNQLQWIRDTLDLIPNEDDVRAVYRMISGEIYASVNPLVLQELSASQNRFAARLRNDAARLRFCDERDVRNTVGWTGWISGAGQAGETHGTSNAVGYHFQTGGTQAVVGYGLGCDTMFGGFYEFTDMAFANSQTGSAQTELNEWGMFFTHHEDFAHITLIGSGGSISNKIRRGFSFGNTAIQLPIRQSLTGDYNGTFASVYGEVGLHLQQGWLSFHPFLGLSYTQLNEGNFVEDGGLFALRVQDSNIDSLRSVLGLDVSALLFSYRSTSLDFRSMWMHDFLFGGVDSIVAGIEALPGGTFSVQGTDIGRDFAVLGTGLSFDLVPGRVRIGGGYDLIINRYQTMNVGSGTLEVVW